MGTLQTMFDADRRLAIVPNVGPLVMPTTKAQYAARTVPLPPNLHSHNDQQNVWQSFRAEGSTQGWGGRMGDLLASQNGRSVFTAISIAGNSVWMSGQQVQQYQVGTGGTIRLGTRSGGQVYGTPRIVEAVRNIVSGTRGGHVLEADLASVSARSLQAEELLRTALKPASDPLFGTPPASGTYTATQDPRLQYDDPVTGAKGFNPLAQQMQVVARMVDASSSPNVQARRQVFFVALGGFDTHDAQNRQQPVLLAKLAHAMRYLDSTLARMGALNKVTAFTASDFGRTFVSNGDGTDHGWGAHHFVMGGAVRGGDLYGTFPVLGPMNAGNNNFDSSPDQLASGVLLPGTSVDQLGATLAKWFGVSDTDALGLFPHLSAFSTRDLGFMHPG